MKPCPECNGWMDVHHVETVDDWTQTIYKCPECGEETVAWRQARPVDDVQPFTKSLFYKVLRTVKR